MSWKSFLAKEAYIFSTALALSMVLASYDSGRKSPEQSAEAMVKSMPVNTIEQTTLSKTTIKPFLEPIPTSTQVQGLISTQKKAQQETAEPIINQVPLQPKIAETKPVLTQPKSQTLTVDLSAPSNSAPSLEENSQGTAVVGGGVGSRVSSSSEGTNPLVTVVTSSNPITPTTPQSSTTPSSNDNTTPTTPTTPSTPPNNSPPVNTNPGEVINFVANAGDQQLVLNWTNPADTDLKTVVIRFNQNGSFPTNINDGTLLVELPATPNTPVSYTHSSLTNGTAIHYRAYTKDTTNLTSTSGATATATPTDMTAPASPTNLQAIAGENQITTTWNGNSETDLSGYFVYYKLSSGSTFTQVNVGNVTQFVISNLTNGVAYDVQISAFDTTNNESVRTSVVNATPTDVTAPPAIQGLTVADSANDNGGSLQLNWTASSAADFQLYRIYRATTAFTDVSNLNVLATSNTNSFTDTTATLNTNYFYAVTAIDQTNNENTTVTSVGPTQSIDNLAPANVSAFSATAGDTQNTLNWTNPTDVDFFATEIRVRTDGIFPTDQNDGTLVVSQQGTAGLADSFTHTNLTNNQSYSYSAFTRDASGNYSTATPVAQATATPLATSLSTALNWLLNQIDANTNLVKSEETNANNFAFTYEQGTSVIALLNMGRTTEANNVLTALQSLQNPDGSLFNSFDSTNATALDFNKDAGPIAFVGLAIATYTQQTGDNQFLAMGDALANYLLTQLVGQTQNPAVPFPGRAIQNSNNGNLFIATEHNIDAYAFFRHYATLTQDATLASNLNQAVTDLATFLASMFDLEEGRFHQGRNGTNFSNLDTEYPADVQTWGVLALGGRGPNNEDYLRAINPIKSNSADAILRTSDTTSVSGQTITGISFSKSNVTTYPQVVWLEQMAFYQLALNQFGFSLSNNGQPFDLLDEIRKTQVTNSTNPITGATETDGGIALTTLGTFNTPPNFLVVPISKVASVVSYIFAFNDVNIFRPFALNPNPETYISYNVNFGPAPLTVNFRGSGVDIDGAISSYQWNFGDGSPVSSTQHPTHQFTTPGKYTVTLTVTDNNGNSTQTTETITVYSNSAASTGWLLSQIDPTTNLIKTTEGDIVSILDEVGMALVALTVRGETTAAAAMLTQMQNLQQPDGSFAFGYFIPGLNAISGDKFARPLGWFGLGLSFYLNQTGNSQFLAMAESLADYFIANRLITSTNFPGKAIYGPTDGNQAYVSLQENIPVYAFIRNMAVLSSNPAKQASYNAAAADLKTFIESMWDNDATFGGRFFTARDGVDFANINFDYVAEVQNWALLTLGVTGPSNQDYSRALKQNEGRSVYALLKTTDQTSVQFPSGQTNTIGISWGTSLINVFQQMVWGEHTSAYQLALSFYSIPFFENQREFNLLGEVDQFLVKQSVNPITGNAAINGGVPYTTLGTQPTEPNDFRVDLDSKVGSTAFYILAVEGVNPFTTATNTPQVPFAVDPISQTTNATQIIVTGTKPAGYAVLLNGQVVVAANADTTWQVVVNVTGGENSLNFQAQAPNGTLTAPINQTVYGGYTSNPGYSVWFLQTYFDSTILDQYIKRVNRYNTQEADPNKQINKLIVFAGSLSANDDAGAGLVQGINNYLPQNLQYVKQNAPANAEIYALFDAAHGFQVDADLINNMSSAQINTLAQKIADTFNPNFDIDGICWDVEPHNDKIGELLINLKTKLRPGLKLAHVFFGQYNNKDFFSAIDLGIYIIYDVTCGAFNLQGQAILNQFETVAFNNALTPMQDAMTYNTPLQIAIPLIETFCETRINTNQNIEDFLRRGLRAQENALTQTGAQLNGLFTFGYLTWTKWPQEFAWQVLQNRNLELSQRDRQWTLYLGTPAQINGVNGNLDLAAAELERYNVVVLGDAALADLANTQGILQRLIKPEVYGYIDIGVFTLNLDSATVKAKIDQWKQLGIRGIYLANAGYDFGTFRIRQNEFILHAHLNGMTVIAEATDPADVCESIAGPLNPNQEVTQLGTFQGFAVYDGIALKGFQVNSGNYETPAIWEARAETALNCKNNLGLRVYTLATGNDQPGTDPDRNTKFAFSYASTILYDFDYFNYQDPAFAGSGAFLNTLFHETQPSYNLGTEWIDTTVTHNGNTHSRQALGGTLSVDTATQQVSTP